METKCLPQLTSEILTGSVFHARHEGFKNSFRYETVMILLDLDTFPSGELFTKRPYLSVDKHNLLAFHRSDHFGDPKNTLKSCVLQLIEEECGEDAHLLETKISTVFLLTTIRCMGYCFNPISIYYCMSSQDPTRCLYIVLEVTNTPWLEKKCYVLRTSNPTTVDDDGVEGLIDVRFMKEMHVSPFFKTDNCEYRIRLNHPGTLLKHPSAELRVLLELYAQDQQDNSEFESTVAARRKLFTATLNLSSHAAKVQVIEKLHGRFRAAAHDLLVICAMAIMAWQAQLFIHWQALKLFFYGQAIIRAQHPAYKGKVRATALYTADLLKHLFVFMVAILGLGVVKSLKNIVNNPVVSASSLAAAMAAVTLL